MLIERLPPQKLDYTPTYQVRCSDPIIFGGFELNPLYIPPTPRDVCQHSLLERLDECCANFSDDRYTGAAFIHDAGQILIEASMLPPLVSEQTIKAIQRIILSTSTPNDRNNKKLLSGIIRESNVALTALTAGYDVYRPDEIMDHMGMDFIIVKDGHGLAIDVKPGGVERYSSKRYQCSFIQVPSIRMPIAPDLKGIHEYTFYEFPLDPHRHKDVVASIISQLDKGLKSASTPITEGVLQLPPP